MRNLLFVGLVFLLAACSMGARQARAAKSTQTDTPTEMSSTDTPQPKRVGKNRVAGSTPISAPATPAPAHSVASSDLRGIYVASYSFPLTKNNDAALTSALEVPGLDGLYMVMGWDALEPSIGQYDWTALDKWVNTAASAGKHIELSIPAEHRTPAWLFQPAPGGGGAKPLAFSFPRKPWDTTCLQETIAAPWDPAFLAQWQAMLAAVSDHLKSAGTYDDITLLRLTGINSDSDELHLPSKSASIACATDGLAIWQQAGYRPSLLLKGWDGITDAFKQSFPDKIFSIAIIASAPPFPAIAEDGSLIKGAVSGQSLPLLSLAAQKFPGHLVIQNNSLYPNDPAQSETIQDAQNLHTLIAFQTNEDIKAQGASCGVRTGGDRTTPCTSATFLNELQTGIYPLGKTNNLRAQYIEVFALNVNAFPDVIQQAHNELLGQP